METLRDSFSRAPAPPTRPSWDSLTAWTRLTARSIMMCVAMVAGVRLCAQVVPSDGQIAYVAQRGGQTQVRVIDVHTQLDQLISNLIDVDQIAWSANKTLAFTARHGDISRITVIDLRNHDMRQLTDDTSFNTNPAWSPDGRWLVFQTNDASGADIYVIDAEGNNLRRLTSDPGFDGDPSWSPDGRHIAFLSSRSGWTDLYVMDLDGGNLHKMTDDMAREEHPVWSPDGTSIAFASHRSMNWDLYLLELATGKVRQLTDSPARDHYPTWSPDGMRVAFESNRDGEAGIYILDLVGDGQVRLLIRENGGSYFPIWQP